MATVSITNLTGVPLALPDLHHAKLPVGGSTTFYRSIGQFYGLRDIQAKQNAGLISVSITLSADEIAAGFADPTSGGSSVSLVPSRVLSAQDRDAVDDGGSWPVVDAPQAVTHPSADYVDFDGFDDTFEEAVGLGEYLVPAGASRIELRLQNEAAAGQVQPKVYVSRQTSGNDFVAFNTTLADLAPITTDGNLNLTDISIPLVDVSLDPGDIFVLVLSRDASNVADTATGDWLLGLSAVAVS